MGEFGNKFRKARENKQLSLDDVSNVTKIGSRMLQAIELEHFDQLPGGVFNKGFIRAYAKHLGLDSEEAVTDYLECLRQAQVDSRAGWDSENRSAASAKGAVAAPPKPAAGGNTPTEGEELPDLQLPRADHIRPARKEYMGKPSYEFPWRIVAVSVIVIVAVAFFWTRHSRAVRTVAAKSGVPTAVVPAAAVTIPAQPASNSTATIARVSASPRQSTSNPEPAKTLQPAAATTSDNPNTTPAKVEEKSDVTIRSFGGSTQRPAEQSAAKLTLVVRATENSWISVTSDGQLVTQETLIAPANASFHATREFVVRVGNAAGVSFRWNGEDLPPQGAEAEAKTMVFDAQGMRAPAPDQISR